MPNISRGFTLIELLIVVLIIAILALIATVNFRYVNERALMAANAANLHTLATALQHYLVDFDGLPPGDNEAGPFMSHTPNYTAVGNGPAAGGSWSGAPWLLYERKYISDWTFLFNPKFLKLYRGGETIRGGWPRFHNFRYAYNSAGLGAGGYSGGAGNIMSGEVWIVRDLWLGPQQGFYASSFPDYPADFTYPWGDGDWEGRLEHAVYSDLAVRLKVGGTNLDPEAAQP